MNKVILGFKVKHDDNDNDTHNNIDDKCIINDDDIQ